MNRSIKWNLKHSFSPIPDQFGVAAYDRRVLYLITPGLAVALLGRLGVSLGFWVQLVAFVPLLLAPVFALGQGLAVLGSGWQIRGQELLIRDGIRSRSVPLTAVTSLSVIEGQNAPVRVPWVVIEVMGREPVVTGAVPLVHLARIETAAKG